MAAILIPSKRTRQPQTFVAVDRSHPLAPATGLWYPQINAITGKAVTPGGTGSEPTITGIPSGRAYYTAGKWLQTDLAAAAFSSFTFVAIIRPTAGPGGSNFCSFLQTGQATLNWNHTSAAYQGALTIYNNGNYPTCKWTNGFTAGKEVVIGGCYNGSSQLLSVYRNGALENSRSSTGNGTSGLSLNSLQFLGGTGGTTVWDGACSYFYWDQTRALDDAQMRELMLAPWSVLVPEVRRIYFTSGGTGATDAAIAGTQATDVGAIAVEATTGAAIAGTQATDVGALTVEAITGAAIAGTQASDIAAAEVTASTGTGTDAEVAGAQASDVGSITVEATLGLAIAATQASDLGYIVVESTLPASMAGTQASDVAAITVAGQSIWTDVGVSAATWSDVGGATSIWTDL